MRIAFVIYSLGGGGAERVTTILSQHWASTGHKVRVMTFAEETANFYQLGPGVEYESLHRADVSRNLWHAITSNISRILILRRRLKVFKPDIVIGIMNTTSALVALSCIGLPCKAIGTERVHPPLDPLSAVRHFIRKVSYWFLDVVVAQTVETARWIEAHTWARVVHVIPNPLIWPLEKKEPFLNPEATCAPGKKIILAVGRLTHQKGFVHLVEAFADLHAQYPLWDLVILGAGPDKSQLEMRRDQLGLTGRVFFPGRAGNIADWYEQASIFAMTSLFEGFPNALLEAMAHGLPVISSDCDTGPRDIIQHNINGLLVAPGDQVALTEGLRKLMDDSELRARLSKEAVGVAKHYAVDLISQRWHALFAATPANDKRPE